MNKPDTKDATPILQRALKTLLAVSPTHGEAGANLRTAANFLYAFAQRTVQRDLVGEPLDECYQLAVIAGVTQKQLRQLRLKVAEEDPSTIGGMLMKQSIIYLTLAFEAQIIANMVFVSREDVEALKAD